MDHEPKKRFPVHVRLKRKERGKSKWIFLRLPKGGEAIRVCECGKEKRTWRRRWGRGEEKKKGGESYFKLLKSVGKRVAHRRNSGKKKRESNHAHRKKRGKGNKRDISREEIVPSIGRKRRRGS